MPNANYRAGREREYRTMRLLEAIGYACTRAASSKGMWDVIAIRAQDIRLVQVKAGVAGPTRHDREAIREVVVPAMCSKEIWWWKARAAEPLVEVL